MGGGGWEALVLCWIPLIIVTFRKSPSIKLGLITWLEYAIYFLPGVHQSGIVVVIKLDICQVFRAMADFIVSATGGL